MILNKIDTTDKFKLIHSPNKKDISNISNYLTYHYLKNYKNLGNIIFIDPKNKIKINKFNSNYSNNFYEFNTIPHNITNIKDITQFLFSHPLQNQKVSHFQLSLINNYIKFNNKNTIIHFKNLNSKTNKILSSLYFSIKLSYEVSNKFKTNVLFIDLDHLLNHITTTKTKKLISTLSKVPINKTEFKNRKIDHPLNTKQLKQNLIYNNNKDNTLKNNKFKKYSNITLGRLGQNHMMMPLEKFYTPYNKFLNVIFYSSKKETFSNLENINIKNYSITPDENTPTKIKENFDIFKT